MIKFLTVPLIAFTFSFSAQAQTSDSKKAPTKEAAEAPKQKPANAKTKVDESIDLDAFFKKGEENAKNGSSCNKPAEPIA